MTTENTHPWQALGGRSFVHPLVDYLLVGGGLSLLLFIASIFDPARASAVLTDHSAWIVVVANGAHFAASTLRLYSKPGAARDHPLVAGVLPLAMLALVVTGMLWAGGAGRLMLVGYMLWSPYHYAGQAFGLCVIYAMRAGSPMTRLERVVVRSACLAPSLHGVMMVLSMAGLGPDVRSAVASVSSVMLLPLQVIAFVFPVALFLWSQARGTRPLPAIVPLLAAVQGIWFFPMIEGVPGNALSTIFHGIQYLVIVIVFHVRDHAQTASTVEKLRNGAWFYVACVALGFLLFQCLPLSLHALGAGAAEAGLLTVAAINLHHFLVDGYIWKVQKGRNRDVVMSGVGPA